MISIQTEQAIKQQARLEFLAEINQLQARAEAAEAALASCNRARQAAEAECEYLRSLYTHQHAIAQEEHARAKDAEAILSQTQAERDEYRAEATQYKNDLAVALETEARQARRIMTLEVHDDTPTNV